MRFDPEQGQTSVLSIPRDLMVNITTPSGQVLRAAKRSTPPTRSAAELGGAKGGIVLAAETIKREVFPELKLNGIVDVNFRGFIQVVDTLGCAYVNVDHRYYNENVGTTETDYTSINLQPGYQKLCYENALDYVRYRHTDSDFVRVARQQDFLRDLREQIDPANEIGQIDTVAKAVGHAITSTFHASAEELIELAKLIAFSQSKPLRQVKFQTTNVDAQINGGAYVTSQPRARAGDARGLPARPRTARASPPRQAASAHHHATATTTHPAALSPRAIGLYPTTSAGESEVGQGRRRTSPSRSSTRPCRPARPNSSRCAPTRSKTSRATVHHAYVIVWQQNSIGGYYDFEGTDWLNPPLFAHARTQTIDGRDYELVDDGAHIHVVGWRSGRRPLLGDEHAARGTLQRADARDRQIRPAAALTARSRPASAAALAQLEAAARAWSRAAFTSASACAFCARGTVRIDQRSKPFKRRERLAVQGLHRLVLDLVDALHLLGDQLRVADHLDLARAQLARALQAEQQRPVLGHVVRDRAEQLRRARPAPRPRARRSRRRPRRVRDCRGRRRRHGRSPSSTDSIPVG